MLDILIASPKIRFDGELHGSIPAMGGVYRIMGCDPAADYVGKSTNMQSRVYRSHFMGNREVSTLKRKLIRGKHYDDENGVKEYFFRNCTVQFIEIADEAERNSFEHFAIAILRPIFND